MKNQWDIIGEEGLQFFGKMTASISHEIKNVLTIINENAGLLEDFTILLEKGTPIDRERLKTLAKKIMKQIRRADGVVINMNRFAHSVDESKKSVDLVKILEFVVALSGRFASMRGVTLELLFLENPVMITTTPFFLENLIWLCLDFAMDATGEGKTVGLMAEKTENGARIRLTKLKGLIEATTDTFPGDREKALLEVLKAELTADIETEEVVITLLRDINSGGG